MKKKRTFAIKEVLHVYWLHIKRYPFAVAFSFIFTVGAFALSTLVPLLYKKIIDTAAQTPTPTDAAAEIMTAVLLSAGALMLFRMFSRRSGSFLITYFQPKVINDLGQTAFSYLLDHSYRFFANNFTGTLVRRVARLQRSFEEIADRFLFDYPHHRHSYGRGHRALFA
jgi:ABC-type multidrug transport system fused ATPase/permease subunit